MPSRVVYISSPRSRDSVATGAIAHTELGIQYGVGTRLGSSAKAKLTRKRGKPSRTGVLARSHTGVMLARGAARWTVTAGSPYILVRDACSCYHYLHAIYWGQNPGKPVRDPPPDPSWLPHQVRETSRNIKQKQIQRKPSTFAISRSDLLRCGMGQRRVVVPGAARRR